MSASRSNDHHEEQDDDPQIQGDDIVEVLEDDGQDGEPMDEDDDVHGEFVPDDGEGPYDGEIVIGGPGPGEEDMDMEGEGEGEGRPDNSWSVSGKPSDCVSSLSS